MTNNPTPPQAAPLDVDAMTRYLLDSFDSVEMTEAMGYLFFFYDGERKMPFATIGLEDNDYDRVSQLDRPGVYRLNIGVRKETYRDLFGPPPAAPGASGVVDTGHDFAALDQLLPHPTYAPQAWVCVLNPGAETWPQVQALLAEGYDLAVSRHQRRAGQD